MRVTFAVVVFAAVIGVALAGASDVETEVEHPVLPGLGAPCLPRRSRSRNWRVVSGRPTSFRGTCTAESACPGAQHEAGYCAGIGVVCCKNAKPEPVPASAAVPADVVSSVPTGVVLKAAAPSKCAAAGGTCGTAAQCSAKKGHTQSGMCPGAASIICCLGGSTAAPTTPAKPTPAPATSSTTSLTQLIRIPAGINAGVSIAGAKGLTAKIGQPGCPLTTACFNCNCAISNTKINRNKVTMAVTPNVRITGLRPFVEAVKRAFDAIKAAGASNPLLLRVYNEVKTAGGLCCRPIKHANGSAGATWSNHSWGAAVDFYFGNTIDPRGDGKCQYGLSLMAPFFNAQKLYWAAGYKGSEEDAMHFEASQQALNGWPAL